MDRLLRARPKTTSVLSSVLLLLLLTNASVLEGKVYECAVGCEGTPVIDTSSGHGDVSPAGVSPAAVTLATTALQAAGVQVTGSFGNQISLSLTDGQDQSQAVQQHCCYMVESRPQLVLPRPTAAAKSANAARLDTHQGSVSMMVDKLLQTYPGLNGTGVKIGVISDSYWEVPDGYKSGKAPSPCAAVNNATILRDLRPSDGVQGRGQGRAMAELICFTAPGAELVFRTGLLGEADMAQGILELAAAGCNIIVDGIAHLTEGEYSAGVITQAVEQVVAQGVAYVSAVGDAYEGPWESTRASWTTVGNRTLHNFGTAAAPKWFLNALNTGTYFYLQWNEPFFRYTNGRVGAWSDIDLIGCPTPELTSACYNNKTDNNGNETSPMGRDPLEVLQTQYGTNYLAIELVDSKLPMYAGSTAVATNHAMIVGAAVAETTAAAANSEVDGSVSVPQVKVSGKVPTRLKLRWDTHVHVEIAPAQEGSNRGPPSITPHANTFAAITVAAAQHTPSFGHRIPSIEGFSSKGGTPIFFDAQGTALPRPTRYLKPDIIGPDGVDNSFFPDLINGLSYDTDGTGFPNFYGTAAAAPAVAAVAALMLQNDMTLTPAEIANRLRASAIPLRKPGYSPKNGYGVVAANRIKFEGCPGARDGTRCSSSRAANGTCARGVCIPQ